MLSRLRKTTVSLVEKPYLVFIFFTFLVTLLRWSSFYQSVIDWDESLYVLVANAWLEDNPPYTTVWDNKPPGIYAIFAIAIAVLGHSVLSIRIFSCLFITITCFSLYKIGSLIERNGRKIGLISGILYAVATLGNGGIAANTELFFIAAVVIAFYLLFKNNFFITEHSSKNYLKLKLLLIGFLLGISFEIKYIVLFDFLALSLALVIISILKTKPNIKYRSILQTISCLSIGFVLPFILVSLYFWLAGHFDDYIYANFTANKLRTVDLKFSFTAPLKAINRQIILYKFLWISIPSAIVYLMIAKAISWRERWILYSSLIWFFTALFGISTVFRGSFYPHYFLQLSPPLCFVTAYILVSLVFSTIRLKQSQSKRYLILGVLLIILMSTMDVLGALNSSMNYVYFTHIKGIKHWNNTPALIAEYLRPRITSDDYIYSVSDHPIVYFLADAKIPTRYAFPPFLLSRKDFPNITGVAPLEELNLILQKQPAYIIRRKSYANSRYEIDENKTFLNRLDQTLAKSYRLETSIKELDLYKLNAKP